jgi:hypothetical protein
MNPNKAEKQYHDNLCRIVGCIACWLDNHPNFHVSVHHCEGRTKPGCHQKVLPLCAGHHQDGTGEDKTMIAIHPWKHRFEERYGTQEVLMEKCNMLLDLAKVAEKQLQKS